MNAQKIRCGVAGVGYLGQHHARIYAELPGAELVGVYDANPARAAEIAQKYACRVFPSLAELGAACEAVSIATPTDLHCEVAVPLLQAGCHLLVEKPLCTSSTEAERILDAARAARRIVQVGHIEHFNPVMGYLESAVTRPRYITAERLAPFNVRGTEVGVVLDLMIHDIGVVLQLVNSPVVSVQSVGVNVLTRTEDIANARIEFANGCVANLNTSRVSDKKVREIRVFQDDAYLSLDFMNQSGHLIRRKGLELVREDIPLEKAEPLRVELASFIDSVARAASPKVDAQLGKSALEVALQITAQIKARSAGAS